MLKVSNFTLVVRYEALDKFFYPLTDSVYHFTLYSQNSSKN